MSASKNAASMAVKAAACPNAAAQAKPQGVFDCVAMGLPREQWVEGRAEPVQKLAAAEQRHQVAVSGLLQVEALVTAILSLTPPGPESCASRALIQRVNQLNTAVLGAILDDGEEIADLQKVVNACQ